MRTINELYHLDKPREKLSSKGAQALKDYELMAVLLGSGTQRTYWRSPKRSSRSLNPPSRRSTSAL
jgi:hypothetical protein